MKPRILITTFKTRLTGYLNPRDMDEGTMGLNHYHYGQNLIPLSVPSSELTYEHKDASYMIRRGFGIDVYVDLYSDGTQRCRQATND